MRDLRGIIPALLTPFAADNTIDRGALRALVRMNIEKGVSAFYVGGSSGEAFLLTADERKTLLETVVDEVAGRCGVIAHIGAISQDTAEELARHARDNGADAVSSLPPFYYHFSFEEIKAYYFGIADAIDIPVILYNIPALSGVSLSVDDISGILGDSRFIGIKHTSSDFYMMNRIRARFPDKFIFNGYDEMFVSGMAMGADGGIGTTYNFMADQFIKMWKLCRQGQYEKARALQSQANQIIEALLRVGVLPGTKEILRLMGLDVGVCRRPFRTLCDAEREMLRRASAELL